MLNIRQYSDRTIINWQDFSIAAGETTRFLQPAADAALLNRVMGGNPSSIYGNLVASGQIYLINPAGILVGPSGRIDTRGFFASTLNVSDDNFVKGDGFTPAIPTRRENGRIEASEGGVFVIARHVNNSKHEGPRARSVWEAAQK